MFGCKCRDCGKFMNPEAPGSSWAHHYDLVGMSLDYTHDRCAACSEKLGPAQSSARPANGDMSTYQGQVTLSEGE